MFLSANLSRCFWLKKSYFLLFFMKNLWLFVALTLSFIISPVCAAPFEDADARTEILRIRSQVKELRERLDKLSSELDRLKSVEKNVSAKKSEPESLRSSEYLELRDEINAINRTLFRLVDK